MTPNSEAELAGIIRDATGPFSIEGGGTRRGKTCPGTVLSTAKLTGISLYEPGALTMVAAAGTPVADVEATLKTQGQRLAFEPMDYRPLLGTTGEPTLGGAFAVNVSGPRRIQVGAARDFLLGVRFVDGNGDAISNGGRVMKNVTGYDLVKLMAGSRGTLGVLSEVSLKVMAQPETEATLVFRGKNAQQGVAALSAALGTAFDVSGAAHLDGAFAKGESRTQVRVEGFTGSVSYRAERLRNGVLAGFEIVTDDTSAQLWQDVRDLTPLAGQNNPVWRISVKPSDGPRLSAAVAERGIAHDVIYDWGGGLMWLMPETELPDAGAEEIRAQTETFGGHATLIRAQAEVFDSVAMVHPQPTPLARIEAGLRARFDPRGLFNPGLMG